MAEIRRKRELELSSVPVTPVCFLIDNSDSMNEVIDGFDQIKETGKKYYADGDYNTEVTGGITFLDKVTEAVQIFRQAIYDDDYACESCEDCIIEFDSEPRMYSDFKLIDEETIPSYKKRKASLNSTNLTKGISYALKILEERREYYRVNNIKSKEPWLIILTDGCPEDDVTLICDKLKNEQEKGRLTVFSMLLSTNDKLYQKISKFSLRKPVYYNNPKVISSYFQYLARSISRQNQNLDIEEFSEDDSYDD